MARTRKKDQAERQTDDLLEELEKRIAAEYSRALKEVQKKYDRFAARFAEEEIQKIKDVKAGKITQDQYIKWRTGKLYTGQRYQDLVNVMAEDLARVDQKAMSIANGYMPEAYALNFNYTTYEIEQGTNVNTGFTLYNRDTVERLVRENTINLPKRKVDIPLDRQWNKKHINSAILQGVLQGDSIPDISKRLQQVTDMDRKAAVRNARTMMTGAQNGGRMAAYERAANLGIDIQKEWMATLDTRTRDSHQKLDGERVDWKKPFSNELMYPGDPEGDPAEVYNCRCTMVPFYPEFESEADKRMTYSEWAQNKSQDDTTQKEQTPIDHRAWIDNVYSKRYKEKEKQEIADLYSQAPYEIQQFYAKYGSELGVMDDNARSQKAFFSPVKRRIQLNGKVDISGSDYQNKYQVSAHEFGHNMDFLAGGKDVYEYFSQKYRNASGKTFQQIIKDDWDKLFRGRYPGAGSVTKEMIKEFCDEITGSYGLKERGDLSDMFESYSVNHGGSSYPFGIGHGSGYWRRTGALSKEAFAEMLDATITNPEALELIKKYLPNAYKAFLDMIRQEVSR